MYYLSFSPARSPLQCTAKTIQEMLLLICMTDVALAVAFQSSDGQRQNPLTFRTESVARICFQIAKIGPYAFEEWHLPA